MFTHSLVQFNYGVGKFNYGHFIIKVWHVQMWSKYENKSNVKQEHINQ